MMNDGLADPTQSRQQSMKVARINREITGLHLNLPIPLPEGTTIIVCSAPVDDWNGFVESEDDQEIRSTHMEWCDGNIIIVELPTWEHGTFCRAFDRNFTHNDIVDEHLQSYGASFVRTNNPRLEPDGSYGPIAAPLPVGLQSRSDWHTLKFEFGLSRRWGDDRGQLDWKASQWATLRGVRYVLCVAILPNLDRAEYKLYTVQGLGVQPFPQAPIPVAAPETVVRLNSSALMGLGPRGILPVGFPDHHEVDLYQILLRARRGGEVRQSFPRS